MGSRGRRAVLLTEPGVVPYHLRICLPMSSNDWNELCGAQTQPINTHLPLDCCCRTNNAVAGWDCCAYRRSDGEFSSRHVMMTRIMETPQSRSLKFPTL